MVFPKSYWQTKAETFWVPVDQRIVQIGQYPKSVNNPEMNGQCERFYQTLISMIGTLETKDKKCWKHYLPTLVHVYNCTKNHAMDFSPYYLMYRWKPRLPTDIRFGLASPQAEKHSQNKFLAKLSVWLRWCYELADLHQCKESTHHKHRYDWKMRASKLEPGDLCLVRQKVFGGKHTK